MNFFEAVANRGSYRDTFLPEAVPQRDIERIVNAGLLAPSGYNYQTTSFVVITEKALLSQVAELMPSPATKTAPVILVALSAHRENPGNGLSFETEDYAAAMENILLAVTALGYAGVWMDGRMQLDDNRDKIRALLGIPGELTPRCILPLGRPEKPVTQKEKLPFSQRVRFNRF